MATLPIMFAPKLMLQLRGQARRGGRGVPFSVVDSSGGRPLQRRSVSSFLSGTKNRVDDDEADDAASSSLFHSSDQKKILRKCRDLHASIMDLNERIRGPLAAQSDQGVALPFVFLVGNHSSGKSSFINYVLGRNVQLSGVAPTDDCFTIIAPGPTDRDQDGNAVTGDPDLGFSSLRIFGPTLQHHTVLKIRSGIDSNFIMVDSPGMIDSPANFSGMMVSGGGKDTSTMDRGYDFTGVVRWYADRADIVCLFFDPDKPGTTGETLSVLLHALSGMDHKLLIILNKADRFEKINDFARAYGSLCWNLSKVIPRKDLPRIYTMCLPVAEINSGNNNGNGNNKVIPAQLQDLHTARDEVVAEVRKAPQRRLDNSITQLQDAVRQLYMHAQIMQDIRQRWSAMYWRHRTAQIGTVVAGGSLAGLLSTYGQVSADVTGIIVAATVLATGGLAWYQSLQLAEWEQQCHSPAQLAVAFQRTHSRAIQTGDKYVASVWQRIRDHISMVLQHGNSIGEIGVVSRADLQRLEELMDKSIPELRRQVSPPHFGKNP